MKQHPNAGLIDLSSDTATRPSAAMREAMITAAVGDEQRDEDPSINELLEVCTQRFGVEAALFMPTGTLCNVIGLRIWTRPGDCVVTDSMAHIVRAEGGNPGLNAGLMVESIDESKTGVFSAEALGRALDRTRVAPPNYRSPATLLSLENTHNFGGGTVWPIETLRSVCQRAKAEGMAVHLDGARLMNAAIAADPSNPWRYAKAVAAEVDSLWLDFTKGLGAPLGAVMMGSKDAMRLARRHKQALGGALRQGGINAAACLFSLNHHVEGLADDHLRARELAAAIRANSNLVALNDPQTNILFFAPATNAGAPSEVKQSACARLSSRALEAGLRFSVLGERLRAVTHRDVDATGIARALDWLKSYRE